MSYRVLLVEDYFPLRLSLTAVLKDEGYETIAVGSAEEAAVAAAESPPDVVLLDWNLPGEQGVSLLRRWRAEGRDWAVIVMTARDGLQDRVTGLDAGAQDYVVKPVANAELLARIRVQLRSRPASALKLDLSGVVVDLARQVVVRDGQEAPLTTREAELLQYLAERPGQAVDRESLLRKVWGYRGGVRTRAVDNAMLRLRGKIERDPARARHLITVHGTGYRFEP